MPNLATEAAAWFGLGRVLASQPVTEGFSHSVFRIEASEGVFALKRLNTELTVGGNPESIKAAAKIELAAIAAGVPAPAPVLDARGEVVVRLDEGDWVRVHEWIHGRTRQSELATADEMTQAAAVLDQLHRLSLTAQEELDVEVPMDWTELASASKSAGLGWAAEFENLLAGLDAATTWASLRPDLPRISSHRDVYPRNVVFSGSEVQLLDWDLAGPTSIDEEVAVAAVEWAGGIVTRADLAAITGFVDTYHRLGGYDITVDRSLFARWLTRQLRWLDYHIRISIEHSDEVATKRVGFLLPRLERQLLEVDDWLSALDCS